MLNKKKLLAAIYSLNLGDASSTPAAVATYLGTDQLSVRQSVGELANEGSVRNAHGRISLTSKGRRKLKVVFMGGGFEVIHRGHLYTIERAKALGDVLVVSVARDGTIRRRKKREPLADERERLRLLSSLRQVDAAILGVEGDIYETLEKVRPDVVALGYDQYHSESDIAGEASKRGLNLKVVRLDSPYPKMKTTSLLNET